MCLIPGLPKPGSEVSVLITRVNLNPSCGLVELWVNMDDGRKNNYKQMKEDIQTPNRKFNGSEGKPGDLCLVCISDTWHRARIVSIQSETCNVHLIDQGQPHITTSEALAWGQSDSFLLPPEIESCILANVLSLDNNLPVRATTILSSLPGKKFKGLVQDVLMPDRIILLDIPILSKHICKGGVAKKIPMDEFKCLVLKCLHLPEGEDSEADCIRQDQYFYPELLIDALENVFVTEVTNPQNIFCKLLIFSKAVEILSEQIHQHYEECSDFGEAQPQTCGDPCAARGLNGRWHRSLLKHNVTSDDAVEVLHVDEGKIELIPVGDIKPLHAKFLRMPVVTYPCSLDVVKDDKSEWTADQTDYLKSLILHQKVMATFDNHDVSEDVYYVTLYADNTGNVNKCFAEKAVLFPPSKTQQDADVQNEPTPSSFLGSLEDERCMDVQNKVNENGLMEKPLPSTERQAINGRTDDVTTCVIDDIQIKDGSEHPDPQVQSNGHLPTGFPSKVQNAHDDGIFTAGSSVTVNISCIESLQKFWCQTTENADSLRLLMQDLQNHYACAHPQPLVGSICVARNPTNKMWYRAKIIASHHSPLVDVRFIDYGHTQKVPLQDLCPIDPAFLWVNAKAFQCCLFNLKNPTNPSAIPWSDSALQEFQKFVSASSNGELKCTVKAVTSDEEGLLLNVVDIETPSDSACILLAQRCAQDEAQVQIPPQVISETYSYSTYSIEVGGKEKVWITSSESVSQFYCQLYRNSQLFEKVMENIEQLIGQTQCTDHPLELDSICFARYTDNQWYRGQIVAVSPKLKVHFVDYGNTLVVNESDIRPIPTEAIIARSVPVLAVPLGLFDVPEEVPKETNQWFADCAVGNSLTITVVAKGPNGKLMIELFDGSLNVNVKIRQMISQMTQHKMTSFVQQTNQQPCNSSRDAPGVNHGKTLDEGRKPTLDVIIEEKETMLAETFIQGSHSDSEVTQLSHHSCSVENVKVCMYKRPNISLNKTEEVYTSCMEGPHYFWCQYANTEDLDMVLMLAQEAGQAQQDITFPKTLQTGSPCLALFSIDNQWYRAQVVHRTDSTLHVVFIDYGNESDVDIKNVRPLPQSLLEKAPQAFLCSLNGYDESKGSWIEDVKEDFSSHLVDKPLKVTVFSVQNYSEIALPQHAVEIECEGVIVNAAMQKYWRPVAKTRVLIESPRTETCLKDGQTESNMRHLSVSKGDVKTCKYKNPNISKNKSEEVYASCIVGPGFFWCQYANTEDLTNLSRLAQEAGQAQQDITFPKTLQTGSPCLALFSIDNQWYRAQVVHRRDSTLHVVFIDYGNESDVDIKNVRPLPQSLLEKAPQAFLCSLNGYDESKGSWIEEVKEDFSSHLVDKPLKVTVFSVQNYSEIALPQHAVEIECEGVIVNAAMQKYWRPVAKTCVLIESPRTETCLKDGQTESNMRHLSVSKGDVKTCKYKNPNISKNKSEEVYASCIVGPGFFWCQYANTEDLTNLSRLAQKAGQPQQDMMYPKILGPGSPCLALFSCDNQWYRAQVIQRTDNTLHVVFVDYGNESDVDIKNVRPLPQSLLEKAPQAFLCSLNGFDESRGSWDDKVHDDFYNLVVDKPLKLTVFNMDDYPDIAVHQYAVQIECEGVAVNTLMEKYWKAVAKECVLVATSQPATLLQDGQTESNMTHLNVSKGNVNTYMYIGPNISENKSKMVYASCIVGPHYFWCQYTNTEDLDMVTVLAQEVGQAQVLDVVFLKTLDPGSPCLALFSSDNQWYRAQVVHRTDNTLHVVFVDYGNESDVDIKDVRPLPQSLLEKAPQAFLCSLHGFVESRGSFDDKVYDDFYNLLIDKPLKLTVFSVEKNSEIEVPQYAVEIECEGVDVNAAMQKYWKPVAKERVLVKSPQTETVFQDGQTESNMTHLSVAKGDVNTCMYKWPKTSQNKTEMVYASCIVGPSFFWCQYANTDELTNITSLAQEAGKVHQDTTFVETLGPGSPCLALYSSDEQWYRALVTCKDGDVFHVAFIDYGNESDVDMKNVRPLPQSLPEKAPQAFLCSLNGFDESQGSWDDEANDDFYNLVVDKPLKLTVFNVDDHSEIAVPQYSVEIDCEGVAVNTRMGKYWKRLNTDHALADGVGSVDQDDDFRCLKSSKSH